MVELKELCNKLMEHMNAEDINKRDVSSVRVSKDLFDYLKVMARAHKGLSWSEGGPENTLYYITRYYGKRIPIIWFGFGSDSELEVSDYVVKYKGAGESEKDMKELVDKLTEEAHSHADCRHAIKRIRVSKELYAYMKREANASAMRSGLTRRQLTAMGSELRFTLMSGASVPIVEDIHLMRDVYSIVSVRREKGEEDMKNSLRLTNIGVNGRGLLEGVWGMVELYPLDMQVEEGCARTMPHHALPIRQDEVTLFVNDGKVLTEIRELASLYRRYTGEDMVFNIEGVVEGEEWRRFAGEAVVPSLVRAGEASTNTSLRMALRDYKFTHNKYAEPSKGLDVNRWEAEQLFNVFSKNVGKTMCTPDDAYRLRLLESKLEKLVTDPVEDEVKGDE